MKCPHCKDDSGVKWVAFQNKCLTRSHDLKAAWQLKTFLTLNWTLHLGRSQNVHSNSLRCFIEEGTHNTRSVEWISWASDWKSGPRDCNNMFVTQNIKINLQPLSLEGQWDKLYTFNKAGGHVVVYVRATCWVGPSKRPLLGHFRPSGQQPLNPDICVSDCLAGTSHSQVPNRGLGIKTVFVFFCFALTPVKLSFAFTRGSYLLTCKDQMGKRINSTALREWVRRHMP